MFKYVVVLSVLVFSALAQNQQQYQQQYQQQSQQEKKQQSQQGNQQQNQQQSQQDSSEESQEQGNVVLQYPYKLYKLFPHNSIQVDFLKKFAISSASQSEYHGQPPVFLTPFSSFKTAYALIPNQSSQKIKDLFRQHHISFKPVDAANVKQVEVNNQMHVPSEFPKPLRGQANANSNNNKMAQAANAGVQQGYLIESPRITNWGVWGDWAECPAGQYVVGMRLRTEFDAYDESALNAIKLFCAAPKSHTYHEISSLEGPWGDWGRTFYCPADSQVVGFQLRSEPSPGTYDNSAANNLRIFCNLPNQEAMVEGDGNVYGYWTDKQECIRGTAITGFRTQVEPEHGWDESALNNVDFVCQNI